MIEFSREKTALVEARRLHPAQQVERTREGKVRLEFSCTNHPPSCHLGLGGPARASDRAERPNRCRRRRAAGRWPGRGNSEPILVDEPGLSWRSRLSTGGWHVNIGHPDYLALVPTLEDRSRRSGGTRLPNLRRKERDRESRVANRGRQLATVPSCRANALESKDCNTTRNRELETATIFSSKIVVVTSRSYRSKLKVANVANDPTSNPTSSASTRNALGQDDAISC